MILFQDGALSRYCASDLKCDPSSIEQCKQVFESAFPAARIFDSTYNLGIALNFDRAEKYAFVERSFDAAYFFEDDLVLGRYYIQIMDRLLEMNHQDSTTDMFSAYGDHKASAERQITEKGKLVRMHHNWGFALFKAHWAQRHYFLSDYLNIISQDDYRKRPLDAFHFFYRRLGYGVKSPGKGFCSQDNVKKLISSVLGYRRLTPLACNAFYIGVDGEHYNRRTYEKWGFDSTTMIDSDVHDFKNISRKEIVSELIAVKRYYRYLDYLPSHLPEKITAELIKNYYYAATGLTMQDDKYIEFTDKCNTLAQFCEHLDCDPLYESIRARDRCAIEFISLINFVFRGLMSITFNSDLESTKDCIAYVDPIVLEANKYLSDEMLTLINEVQGLNCSFKLKLIATDPQESNCKKMALNSIFQKLHLNIFVY